MRGLSLGLGFTMSSSGGGGSSALRSTAPHIFSFDAVRTWYNYPVVLNDGGQLYAGGVTANGSEQVHKTNAIDASSFTLAATLEVDDHNEATLLKLPNGKLACFYSKHSTDALIRYRVSSNALPDISAFAAEKSFTDSQVSYTLPFLLSDGNVRVFYRRGLGGPQRERRMAKTPVADLQAGTESWTLSTIFATTNERPYMVATQNGTDRIDFAMNTGNPDEVSSSLYHCYMQLVGGVEKYYTSAGVEIFTPIDVVTSATLVDNATGGRVWNDKIAIGPDGHPRMLFPKYPTGTTGIGSATFSNIEYWHARWDGSVWIKTLLSTGQVSIASGAGQGYYYAGMCFDGNDCTILYLCEKDGSFSEIKKYSFNESTGAKTLIKSITAGSTTHNFRPQSPSGSDRPYEVTWLDGTYTGYTSYATRMKASGAVIPTVGVFTPADLFASAEKGGWWDPSDFSTMFQDTAGTTPVTATGQSVARINDKSGNAKHLLQSTAGSRPTLQQDGAGKYYLDFDGTADFMSVTAVDLSGTDAATAIAGVRKSSDAAAGIIFEHSASSTVTSGTIAMFAPLTGASFAFRHKGSGGADASAGGNPAPMLAVVSGSGDISGDLNQIRVNGGLAGQNTIDQGTGNLTSQTFYVGARAGTSLFFAGRLYGLIVRAATTTNATLATAEAWMNEKTGAY